MDKGKIKRIQVSNQTTSDATLLQKRRQQYWRSFWELWERAYGIRSFRVNVALEKALCPTRRHSSSDNDAGIRSVLSCLLLSFSLFPPSPPFPSSFLLPFIRPPWLLRHRFPFLRWQWPSTVEKKIWRRMREKRRRSSLILSRKGNDAISTIFLEIPLSSLRRLFLIRDLKRLRL